MRETCHGDNRLFVVGVGSGVNSFFVKELARLGQGDYVFVGNKEEIGNAMALMKRALLPSLKHVDVQWQYPKDVELACRGEFARVYHGQPVVILGVLKEGFLREGEAIVHSQDAAN